MFPHRYGFMFETKFIFLVEGLAAGYVLENSLNRSLRRPLDRSLNRSIARLAACSIARFGGKGLGGGAGRKTLVKAIEYICTDETTTEWSD